MSWFFVSGDQSTGASASVLPMNVQDWSPSGWTGWISSPWDSLSLLQHHSSKASILRCSAFFMDQLSHLYIDHLKLEPSVLIPEDAGPVIGMSDARGEWRKGCIDTRPGKSTDKARDNWKDQSGEWNSGVCSGDVGTGKKMAVSLLGFCNLVLSLK